MSAKRDALIQRLRPIAADAGMDNETRDAAGVLFSLIGAILSDSDRELLELCAEHAKYQIAMIRETLRGKP